MGGHLLLQSFISLVVVVVLSRAQCNPVVEGQEFSLECLFPFATFSPITWARTLYGEKSFMSVCENPNGCYDHFPDHFTTTIQKGNGSYVSIFTVHVASRGKPNLHALWECISIRNQDILFSCNMNVTSAPTTPVCDEPKAVNESLRLTCSTASSYPEANCLFEVDGKYLDGQVSYTNTKFSVDGVGYANTTCSIESPFKDWTIGYHTVILSMIPADSQGGVSLWNVSTSVSVYLTSAKVALDNCPYGRYVQNGFIKAGTEATCDCVLSYDGFPPATVGWVDSNDNLIGQFEKKNSTLKITKESSGLASQVNFKYVCISKAAITPPLSIFFKPRFAYGPKSINVSIMFNNCTIRTQENEATIFVTTRVAAEAIAPYLQIEVEIKRDETTVEQKVEAITDIQSSESGFYLNTFNLTVPRGLNLTLLARAYNPLFTELRAESQVPVFNSVKVSHMKVTVKNNDAIINSGSIVTINEFDDVHVTCETASNMALESLTLSLSCGQTFSSTSYEKTVEITFTVNRSLNDQRCTCVAVLASACHAYGEFEFYIRVSPKPTLIASTPSSKPTLIARTPSPKPTLIASTSSFKPTLIASRPSSKPTLIASRPFSKPILTASYPTSTPSSPKTAEETSTSDSNVNSHSFSKPENNVTHLTTILVVVATCLSASIVLIIGIFKYRRGKRMLKDPGGKYIEKSAEEFHTYDMLSNDYPHNTAKEQGVSESTRRQNQKHGDEWPSDGNHYDTIAESCKTFRNDQGPDKPQHCDAVSFINYGFASNGSNSDGSVYLHHYSDDDQYCTTHPSGSVAFKQGSIVSDHDPVKTKVTFSPGTKILPDALQNQRQSNEYPLHMDDQNTSGVSYISAPFNNIVEA